MTTPGAPPAQGQWWVMAANSPRPGSPPFQAVQSATRPKDTAIAHVAAGPFATKTDAENWIQQQDPTGIPIPSIPNPLSLLAGLGWIQEIGHWAGILVSAITDLHTYISLGWLMLGFILLIIGILMWLRTTDAYQNLSATARTAAVAAA